MDDELQVLRDQRLKELMKTMSTGTKVATGHPIQLNDADFDSGINGAGLILVDFWAPWCAPCRMVAPVLEAIAKDYAGRLTIGKLNTDENPRTAMRFNIMSIPTMVLFKDGKPVDSIMGAVPRAQIEAVVKRHMAA